MNSIKRRKASSLGDLMTEVIRQSGLAPGMNTHRIFEAWDQASGAGRYTIRRYFRDGILYITVGSSVICSQLQFQKRLLTEKINAILEDDSMFIKGDHLVGYVKDIIIK